ncbi:MAG: hypothetical protein LBR23_07770 [Spirochaetaceae bacterium]|nr:hypothetical protein [Spirochaetaceae bacterium]
MGGDIVFKDSAFKHGYTEEDIYNAIQERRYDELFDGENRYLLIGSDRNGNLIEILYNLLEDDQIRIFHAMKCRKEYYALLSR